MPSNIYVSGNIWFIQGIRLIHNRFEFYVGNIRRKFSAMPDTFCFAAASPDAVSAFAFTSASTRGRATDTQLVSASNFHPGQRILTLTTLNSGVGCYEVWINGTHFIEQGNQKSTSTNYQATSTCPLCHNCASSSACEGRCNRNGELKCSDPRTSTFSKPSVGML